MTKFVTLVNLIACFPLVFSKVSFEKKGLNNNETPPPYKHLIATDYTPSEFVRIGNFDMNMNLYVDTTNVRFALPLYKLDKSVTLNYELYYKTAEGIRHTLLIGEHKASQSSSLPSSGLFSVVFYFDPTTIGERSTFVFRFFDHNHKYLEHTISFYLTGPGTFYHYGRYARVFYRTILSEGQLKNYEDRVDFYTIADEYFCDYYIKIPFSDFKVINNTPQSHFYDTAYFLLYDDFGFFDGLMREADDGSGYLCMDIDFDCVDITDRIYSVKMYENYYINQDTFVSYYFDEDGDLILVNDLYVPIQRYEMYYQISCGIYLVNVGRSKTCLIHPFELFFEKKYIYSAINTSRGNPGKFYSPKMEEHTI